MLNSANIKDFVEAFLAESDRRAKAAAGPDARGVTASYLGKLAVKDPSAVSDLRAGVEFRAKKIAQFGEAIEATMPGFTASYFLDKTASADDAGHAKFKKTIGRKIRGCP